MKAVVKKLWWVPVLILLVYAGAIFAMGEGKSVPAEFSEARIEGAALAQEIVAISSYSLENLKKIAALDKEGNAPEALILISQEVIKNREMQTKAVELSSKLERMAILIPQISPSRARYSAIEGVSAQMGLVGRLITYTNDFYALFQILEAKLENKAGNVDAEIKTLVDKINEEARAINSQNAKFTASLAEFDSVFTR